MSAAGAVELQQHRGEHVLGWAPAERWRQPPALVIDLNTEGLDTTTNHVSFLVVHYRQTVHRKLYVSGR